MRRLACSIWIALGAAALLIFPASADPVPRDAPADGLDAAWAARVAETRGEAWMRAETLEGLVEEVRSRGWAPRAAAITATKQAPVDYSCIPSCNAKDGRLLAVNASDLITFTKTSVDFRIVVSGDAASFRLGVFDGDGGTAPSDNWDIGLPADYRFRLFTEGEAPPETVLDVSSTDMLDNAWCCDGAGTPGDFVVATSAAARAANGQFLYRLRIEPVDDSCLSFAHFNGLKVRTSGRLSLEPGDQPLAYIPNMRSASDVQAIYPELDLSNIPDFDPAQLEPTNYDGTFSVFFEVYGEEEELSIWDGDFDRGRFDLTELDTDDPDSGAFPSFEGFEEGCGTMLPETDSFPAPFDDMEGAGLARLFLRSPTIHYELHMPDGRVVLNNDPSGNQEWEKFTLSTLSPFDRSRADVAVETIPPGTYELRVIGLDMQNLIALRLPYRLVPPPDVGGQGCTPGYWKQRQHFDSWVGYDPNDSFSDVFGVDEGDLTLLGALQRGGGGTHALGRHAVAALLDAANTGVDYRYSESLIVGLVQRAYADGEYEATKNLLAVENERGCPLN